MNRNHKKERLIKQKLSNDDFNSVGVLYYDKVTSTMDVAAGLDYNSLVDPTVIVAEEQTHGRGRFERKWYSSNDDSMFSIVLKNFNFSVPYSMIASLGVYNVIHTLSSKVGLKWINDVFWGDRKISGILTEEKNNRTIIGIGVNLNTKDFPFPISNIATSLFLETGKHYDKIDFTVRLIKSVLDLIDKAHENGVEELLKQWERASKMREAMVRVETVSGVKTGLALGIDYKTGALKLKTRGEIIKLYDGTVTFIKNIRK